MTCLASSAVATGASERLKLVVGQSATVRMDANPSTGFSWVVDPAIQNLEAVGIENLGVEKTGRSDGGLSGKPVVQRFRLTGRVPGQAIVVFSYLRGWENKPPARQQVFVVDVRNK